MGAPAFQFLDVTLRPSLRQLSRRGRRPLALGSRAYDLLLHLVAHAGRVVPRDELMQAVWGDTVVGDNNLNVQVASLRQLLGREAVITVPDRGLRFGHPVRRRGGVGVGGWRRPPLPAGRRWWCCRLPIWRRAALGLVRRLHRRGRDDRALALSRSVRGGAQLRLRLARPGRPAGATCAPWRARWACATWWRAACASWARMCAPRRS
jgi:DNA-binding winged helix-turn-helix (wHTH) protein